MKEVKFDLDSQVWDLLARNGWARPALDQVGKALLMLGTADEIGGFAATVYNSVWPEGEATIVRRCLNRVTENRKHYLIGNYCSRLRPELFNVVKERIWAAVDQGRQQNSPR